MSDVDWAKFDISPKDHSKKVTGNDILEVYKQYDGNRYQFAGEFDTRFAYSGAMCEWIENICEKYDKSVASKN